jgi:hypothetical protein
MAGAAVHDLGVEVGSAVGDEAIEEVMEEFNLKIANEADFYCVFVNKRGAAAEIDCSDSKCLVHRQHEVACAIDAYAIAQRFREELAENDAAVFDGVVLIDIEVTGGMQSEIEPAVLGEQLEHMVEEADAGPHVVTALPFDLEGAVDLRFFGDAFNLSGSQRRTPVG